MFMRTRYFKPCPLLPIASQKTTCKLWEVISYSHKVHKIKAHKNREVETDNTSCSHITSWQSQSLGNRSPDNTCSFLYHLHREHYGRAQKAIIKSKAPSPLKGPAIGLKML